MKLHNFFDDRQAQTTTLSWLNLTKASKCDIAIAQTETDPFIRNRNDTTALRCVGPY